MQIFFPHKETRETQDSFIKDIISSIKDKKNIIAHVPTGIGKTAAILSTTISLALKKNLTIFFLTPRHTQHKIAIETLSLIKNKFNLDFNVTDFIGKRHMCIVPNISTSSQSQFYEYCKDVREKQTCEFYMNLKKEKTRLKLFLKELNILNVEDLISKSKKERFCPFEVSCELAKKSNVIIADYYHILSPKIRDNLLKRINKNLSSSIIIFDEAHNLPQKSRELLTSTLSTYSLELAFKESKQFKLDLPELEDIKNILLNLSKKVPFEKKESLVNKQDFDFENYTEFLLNLKLISKEIIEEKKHSYLNSLATFLLAWKGSDQGFVRILKKEFIRNKPHFSLNYKCLDPSLLTKDIIDESYLTIAMSGTLTPLEMYKDILGFNNVSLLQYKNPFPKKNKLNLIIPGLTTKFTLRSSDMYEKIAIMCSDLVNNIPGNIIIYFPSYNIKDNVDNYFKNLCKKTTFSEHPRLTKEEKNSLLEKFKSYKDKGAVLLAVSSGSFGEGIDLIGDFLKGVLIVGIPLSQPNLETQALIKYYDLKYKKGWDYAYIYPAIITSIQNSGRCIRSETDKGIIAFIDERYKWNNYLKCFPPDFNLKITKNPLNEINNFLNNNNT